MTDAPALPTVAGDDHDHDDGNNDHDKDKDKDKDAENDNDNDSSSTTNSADELRFCTECLAVLKQPTAWCGLACAAANFAAHREEVHRPLRRKLGLGEEAPAAGGEEEEEEGGGGGGGGGDEEEEHHDDDNDDDGRRRRRRRRRRRYPTGDVVIVREATTSLGDAVREWEGRNKVRLEDLV
ncbi:hypothetical protein VTH06DRAFT_1124 [Thermothelomyces fergusii]